MNLAGRKILTRSSSLRLGSKAFTGENNFLVLNINSKGIHGKLEPDLAHS